MLDRLLSGEQAELALGASIVERDVQAAEGAHGLFDERDDVILLGDISSHEQGASTGRSNLLGELLSPGNAAAGDEHIRTFFGKRQGSGFADARGTSSNKDSFVFEDFHNCTLMWPVTLRIIWHRILRGIWHK
jgi:hypothetical protein